MSHEQTKGNLQQTSSKKQPRFTLPHPRSTKGRPPRPHSGFPQPSTNLRPNIFPSYIRPRHEPPVVRPGYVGGYQPHTFTPLVLPHAAIDGKPPLPYGWIVKQSKTFPDRVYYFNTFTGASSWEIPELLTSHLHPDDTVYTDGSHFDEGTFSPDEDHSNSGSDTDHAASVSSAKETKVYSRDPRLKNRNLSCPKEESCDTSFADDVQSSNVRKRKSNTEINSSKVKSEKTKVESEICINRTSTSKAKTNSSLSVKKVPDKPISFLEKLKSKPPSKLSDKSYTMTSESQQKPPAQLKPVKSPTVTSKTQTKPTAPSKTSVQANTVTSETRSKSSDPLISAMQKKHKKLKNKSSSNASCDSMKKEVDVRNVVPNFDPLRKVTTSTPVRKASSPPRKVLPKSAEISRKVEQQSALPKNMDKIKNIQTWLETIDPASSDADHLSTSLEVGTFDKLQERISKYPKSKVSDHFETEDQRKVVLSKLDEMKPSADSGYSSINTPSNPDSSKTEVNLDFISPVSKIYNSGASRPSYPSANVSKRCDNTFQSVVTPIKNSNQDSLSSSVKSKHVQINRDFKTGAIKESSRKKPYDRPRTAENMKSALHERTTLISKLKTTNTNREPPDKEQLQSSPFTPELSSTQTSFIHSFNQSPQLCQSSGLCGSSHTLEFSNQVTMNDEEEDMEVDDPVKTLLELSEVRVKMKTSSQVVGILTESVSTNGTSRLKKTQKVAHREGVYIIIDTNILIQDLQFVQELRDEYLYGFDQLPTLVIPWIVMQELDSIKNSKTPLKTSANCQRKAMAPVKFLHHCLNVKHPRIIGQTPQEAKVKYNELDIECNDDKVLQCCIQYIKMFPSAMIILLTNDINLSNKAMIMKINSLDRKNFHTGLADIVSVNSTYKSPPQEAVQIKVESPVRSLPTPVNQASKPQRKVVSKETQTKWNQKSLTELTDDVFCHMKCVLKDIGSTILETELKSAYDDIWEEIVFKKPPWTLQDIWDSIDKHWIAVFGIVLNRDLSQTVKNLKKTFESGKGYGQSLAKLESVIMECLAFLNGCSSRPKYGNDVKKSIATLKKLKDICRNIIAKKWTVAAAYQANEDLFGYKESKTNNECYEVSSQQKREGNPVRQSNTSQPSCSEMDYQTSVVIDTTQKTLPPETDSIAVNKFQQVWESIHENCTVIHQSLTDDSLSGNSQFVHAEELLSRFIPVLKRLKTAYQKCLELPPRDVMSYTDQFSLLCNELNNFFTNTGMNGRDYPVSVRQLQVVFQDSSKRQLLEAGHRQLEEMALTVYKCVQMLPD